MNIAAVPVALGMGSLPTLLPPPTPALVPRVVNLEAEVPHCAIPCFHRYCETFNATCFCGQDKEAVDGCVLTSCTLPEAIFTRNATEITCQTPVRNRSTKFNITILVMTGFAVVLAAARLVYKQFFSARRRLNSEDWTMVAALVLGLPSVVLTIVGLTAHGMGTDLWGLPRSDLIAFGRYFYVIQIIYILLMLLVKLTLTFFYLNIFFGRTIRALLWWTVAFHVATAVAFTIGIIFQCLPINFQWEKYNYINKNTVQGHCININAAGWANSGISVASDIWLLAIPLSQIHKLHLHWKKKLGAALMFTTGASVTVVSFLRLASVKGYYSTSNPTWDQWDIVWWSTIEVEVGLICTCLPAIRLILVRLAPRVFGSTQGTSSITMNQITTKSSRHTRIVDEEEAAPAPKRASAPASTSVGATLQKPERVMYSCRNATNSSDLMGATDSHREWGDEIPLQETKKPSPWRNSVA